MAREKDNIRSTKYAGIKETTMENNEVNYLATFNVNNKRYNQKNLSKLGAKTAKQAYDLLIDIKRKLREGEDPFSTKSNKIDFLVTEYLKDKSADYKKFNTYTYDKWIKPIIGHKYIEKVTKEDLLKIKEKMQNATSQYGRPYKSGTLIKLKKILTPIFKEAHRIGAIKINELEPLDFGSSGRKPQLNNRIKGDILDTAKEVYRVALNYDIEFRAIFLMSVLCTRRIGELVELKYEDIEDGVVLTRASTTKTNKSEIEYDIVDRYPIPEEVLKLLTPKGKGKVFKYAKRTYSERYRKMIDKADIEMREGYKEEWSLRSHDNRNFMMSLASKKFSRELVGSATLSHTDKSNINERYLAIEYKTTKEIYEYYWGLLRGTINEDDNKIEDKDAESNKLKVLEAKVLLLNSSLDNETVIRELKKLFEV